MRVAVPLTLTILAGSILAGCATAPRTSHYEREAKDPMTPSPGDLRAEQLAYPTGRLEPAWFVDAAQQARAVADGIPAGIDATLARGAGVLALDPERFTPLGPRPIGTGSTANAGRINVVAVDPVDPAIAYAGSDGGGVWKTTNCCSAATTWTVKTDIPEIASMAIGDLTIDPNDRNVLYAGTGDLRFGSFSFGAAGVLKSTDQGETWTLLGSDVFSPFLAPLTGSFPQYQAIGKVVVDPNDSNKVIVGAKTGVYFSYDAGANWVGPCNTNSHATQRQDTTGLVAVDAGIDTLLYAAIGTRGQPTPVQPDLDRNGANGVYRTTVPASGCPASWTLLANNWPANTGNGVAAATNVGRIELAVAPSDPSVIYAMVSDTVLNNGVLGVWKSTNGGDAWTQTAAAGAFGGCDSEGTQMWYDAGVTVHPTNPDIVYASAVDVFRTTTSGSSFTNLTCSYFGGNVHPDQHARAFVGNDPDRLLIGNDGGVFYSSNASAASPTFIPLNATIDTIEFYSGDITANFATATTPGISGGAQDNGSNTMVWTNGMPAASAWTRRLGGDGIFTRIEPVLGRRWYYSSQNGSVRVAQNGPGGTTVSATAPGAWGGDTLSFVMPFELYRYGTLDAPGSGCTTAAGCTRMIAGTNRVWESILGGIPTSSWYANSPNLTKGTLGARSFINQLSHAVSDPSVAVAGTNDGNVWRGTGLGTGAANAIWTNVTGGNAVLPNRPVLDVATDPLDTTIVYAAVGGFDQNTPMQPGHVFRLACGADCATAVWEDKTGNLPNIPADSIIANPHRPNQVFVGTDWGLYFTDDISATNPVWQRHEGLPHVMVWDMAIDRGFTTLAVFTRSRGAWVWPLPTAVAQPDALFSDGYED